MKLKEKVKNSLNGKILKIIILLLAVGVVAALVTLNHNKKQAVDTTYIISTLEKASELTTAKLNYTGMSKFEDSGIPFISKSNFSIVYKATARAGIDVKEIKIDVDNAKQIVFITIPKAKVLDVKVDASTIQFFDTKFSLFNINAKEDGMKALSLAEEEAKKEVANMGVLEMADEQSEALVKGLIQDAVPKEYKIEIRR